MLASSSRGVAAVPEPDGSVSSPSSSISPWTESSSESACRPLIAGPTGAYRATWRRIASSRPSILPAAAASSTARSRPALTASSTAAESMSWAVGELLGGLLVGKGERQLLAADVELAGGSVERRERDSLEDAALLEDALIPRLARVGGRGRLVGAAAEGDVDADQADRGGKGDQRGSAAITHRAPSAFAVPSRAIGISASAASAAAARNGQLKALVAARSSWSSMSASSCA